VLLHSGDSGPPAWKTTLNGMSSVRTKNDEALACMPSCEPAVDPDMPPSSLLPSRFIAVTSNFTCLRHSQPPGRSLVRPSALIGTVCTLWGLASRRVTCQILSTSKCRVVETFSDNRHEQLQTETGGLRGWRRSVISGACVLVIEHHSWPVAVRCAARRRRRVGLCGCLLQQLSYDVLALGRRVMQ